MKFDKITLFEKTKALWPEEVRTEELSEYGLPEFGDLFNEIYWRLESSVDDADEWLKLSIWSYHQALGECKKTAIESYSFVVNTRSVEFSRWDHFMLFNMEGEDLWSDYLKVYLNDK
ncbi:MAG: hypothetical protein ACK41P_00425 [Asticcacaulis sp.]